MVHLGITIFMALGTISIAQGYEVKNDKKIEASAAARAASRIGEIRGTIPHTKQPDLVTRNTLRITPNVEESQDILPRPAWKPPQVESNPLPPVVKDRRSDETDDISTGSVNSKPMIRWELFDKYGRPIEREGYWIKN